ncbi:serine carboxypeptidase 1-like [Typha angustifolia]|uniref:serine carboxypeptidase 1-like n=1 Tax=Typha angustifolia TaxID=59011 RepID=UPI003C2F7605
MEEKVVTSLLLFLFFFLAFHYTAANDGERLVEMIKLKRSQNSLGYRTWDDSKVEYDYIYNSVYVGFQDGLREADKIVELPGQPQGVEFNQFAGYVTVDPKAGRALFYYFAEAANDPSEKPLVLWLNGGPGCSSLGGGAMLELGPFFVNSDNKTLYSNLYAWNKAANMLFLESPAGVGFSYSNTTSDYNASGDKRTTEDSYTFLINWLERFPEYKDRDFFITGESYAGHYIPELANAIVANNNADKTIIKLRGVAIGNAYFDDTTNTKATYEYLWTHAMISSTVHDAIKANCSFDGTYTESCLESMRLADQDVGNIDFYNIYAPVCHDPSKASNSQNSMMVGDPCSDRYVFAYLNLPAVQRALHANTTGLNYPWIDCSDVLHKTWKDAPTTMLPAIKKLIASGIRTWLYSGDIDSIVPVTSTQYSLDILGLPVEKSWRPWYTDNAEVGGYVVEYKGLVFATVRGAGHMVPRYQPQRALTLFSSFLQGKLHP